jgi:flavin reductase (DIM6/NTAB) family NADH-FMN oxidoreductase RutF
MARQPISPNDLTVTIHDLWENQWLLLTGGDFSQGKYNSMTVAWGGLGFIWDKPFVQIVVRPTRYTYRFLELYPTFTLCAFSEEYRRALKILGARSGRDEDKIAASGLTPEAASCVAAPVFTQAELTLECRKMYWADLQPPHFVDPAIDRHYPLKDYHRIYYGEIIAVTGEAQFSRK